AAPSPSAAGGSGASSSAEPRALKPSRSIHRQTEINQPARGRNLARAGLLCPSGRGRGTICSGDLTVENYTRNAMDELAVEHHHITINGINMHYVTAGSGPLCLLLHGFPEFWYSWRHQIPALARHFTVVAPDQ